MAMRAPDDGGTVTAYHPLEGHPSTSSASQAGIPPFRSQASSRQPPLRRTIPQLSGSDRYPLLLLFIACQPIFPFHGRIEV